MKLWTELKVNLFHESSVTCACCLRKFLPSLSASPFEITYHLLWSWKLIPGELLRMSNIFGFANNFSVPYTRLTRSKAVRQILLKGRPQALSETVRGLSSTECFKKGLNKYYYDGNPLHDTSFPSKPSGVPSLMKDIHKHLLSSQLSRSLR